MLLGDGLKLLHDGLLVGDESVAASDHRRRRQAGLHCLADVARCLHAILVVVVRHPSPEGIHHAHLVVAEPQSAPLLLMVANGLDAVEHFVDVLVALRVLFQVTAEICGAVLSIVILHSIEVGHHALILQVEHDAGSHHRQASVGRIVEPLRQALVAQRIVQLEIVWMLPQPRLQVVEV